MSASFRDAARSSAKPLVGIYAESGRGKTWSSLLLARGFAGAGRIGMIETESGRGEAYADMVPGGYSVLPLRNDFSPKRYGEALRAAEQEGFAALIIDSASHEWEGAGGVLSMAADNQSAGKSGPIVWQKPKMEHQREFMLPLMQTSIPLVIVCMRAKYPMQERSKPGSTKKEWVRSEILEPTQSDAILFEMFVHGWIDAEHRFHGTKYTRPDLRDVIRDGEPITLQTGERLAAWSRGEPGKAALVPELDPDLGDKAERIARTAGTDAYRTWWNGLGPDERAFLLPGHEERKKLAAEADRNLADSGRIPVDA